VAISWLAKLECESIGRGATNDEFFEVDRSVVEIADGREIAQLVTAAAALVLDMM